MTKLTKAQLELYEGTASSAKQIADGRNLATHKRYSRGVIKVPHGPHTIVFYPIKDCLSTIGVTNQTLRKWVKEGIILCEKRYGMHTFCKAEQVAIRRVVDRYWDLYKRNAELPPSFQKEIVGVLNLVRDALETLKKGMHLTDLQRSLLTPSLDESMRASNVQAR